MASNINIDLDQIIRKKAIFDTTKQYRYTLSRKWSKNPTIAWIMLNPSTADQYQLDPTNRRVMNFSKRWGYGSFVTINLFAYRSTNPSKLREVPDAVGSENDKYIKYVCKNVSVVIAAWGTHGEYLNRGQEVLKLIDKNNKLFCLKVTKKGHPQHPLYISNDTIPVPYGWSNKKGDKNPFPLFKGRVLDDYF